MATLEERNMKIPESGGSGTYTNQVAMFLLFKDEIMSNSRFSLDALPQYDWGTVTEVLPKNQYKVNLSNLGSVVIVKWSSQICMKGATVLVYIKPNQFSPGGGDYVILAVRQTGSYTPQVSEYPV